MNDICGISLDFDDVMYNLTKINLEFIEREYGIKLDPLKINRFSYYIDEGYKKIIEGVWNNKDVYITSELYNEAKEFYIKLIEKYGRNNVQIVTTSLPNIIPNKNKMIKERFEIDCSIIHTNEKHLHTRNTILVDDSPKNIIQHIEKNIVPGIVFDLGYGWNKDLKEDNKLIFRGNSYNETFDIISNLFNRNLTLEML